MKQRKEKSDENGKKYVIFNESLQMVLHKTSEKFVPEKAVGGA